MRGAQAASSVAAKAPAAAAAESAPASVGTEATAAAASAPAAAAGGSAEGAYAANSGARAHRSTAALAFAAAGASLAGKTPSAKLGARAPAAAAAPAPAPAEAACTPAAPRAAPQQPAGAPALLPGAAEADHALAQPAGPLAQQAPAAAGKRRFQDKRRERTPALEGAAGAKRASTGGGAARRPKKQAYTAMGFPAITPTPGRSRDPGARVPSPDENDARGANARGGAAQNPAGIGSAAPAIAPSRAPFGALPTVGAAFGSSSPAVGAPAGVQMPSEAQSYDEGPRHGILCTSSGAPHALRCSPTCRASAVSGSQLPMQGSRALFVKAAMPGAALCRHFGDAEMS